MMGQFTGQPPVTFTLKIPGKAYHLVLDPRVTNVPKDECWPKPELRMIGFGLRAHYTCTVYEAGLIRDQLLDYADSWSDDSQPDVRVDGRYLRQVADHVVRQMHESGLLRPGSTT